VQIPNTEDAWPKIEADFQFAAENLPDNSDAARQTDQKWAALAYLGKCHMFQGFPKGQAQCCAPITAAKAALVRTGG
jgi:hypothetical protein